jgi:hypothetical protein
MGWRKLDNKVGIEIYSVEKSGDSPEPPEFETKHVNVAGNSVEKQPRIATAWKRTHGVNMLTWR